MKQASLTSFLERQAMLCCRYWPKGPETAHWGVMSRSCPDHQQRPASPLYAPSAHVLKRLRQNCYTIGTEHPFDDKLTLNDPLCRLTPHGIAALAFARPFIAMSRPALSQQFHQLLKRGIARFEQCARRYQRLAFPETASAVSPQIIQRQRRRPFVINGMFWGCSFCTPLGAAFGLRFEAELIQTDREQGRCCMDPRSTDIGCGLTS